MRITREPWDPFPITMPLERRIFSCCRYDLYDLSAMVPPIYKKPPGPKDTGGQTGNLLYKYYTTHWQNVNDTMLIWCGSHRAVQIFQFHFINLLFQKQFKPITALQRNKDIDIYYQHPCSNYYTISGSL